MNRPLLSVIIPAFNESRTIREIIRRVSEVPIEKEILVVDDGSTDETKDILQQFMDSASKENHLVIRVFRHPRRLGKGAAIQTALREAAGELTIIQDADLEYDPRD